VSIAPSTICYGRTKNIASTSMYSLPDVGRAITATPHAQRLGALPTREQYIEMELWRGLMSNHHIVAHDRNTDSDKLKVCFNGDDYLRYLPFRLPWTMCVQEHLPPEAAGALVNQTHLFPDLFLLIDAAEKQMYEAIDGRRTIGEIVGIVEESGLRAKEFFQKLWWYDQVVFDTSKAWI
jgi:hypothetical protein